MAGFSMEPPSGGAVGGSWNQWFLILQSQPLYVVIKNWTWSWIGGVALLVGLRGGGCQARLGSAWSPPQGGLCGGSLRHWFLMLQSQPIVGGMLKVIWSGIWGVALVMGPQGGGCQAWLGSAWSPHKGGVHEGS